jgi:hypothetical protein
MPKRGRDTAPVVAVPVATAPPTAADAAPGEQSWRTLVCPIQLELPVEPVLADDGYVYERHALYNWMRLSARKNKTRMRSPMTNEMIRAVCIPVPAVRRCIRAMVVSGQVPDDVCEAWRRELAFEPRLAAARSVAKTTTDAPTLLLLASVHLHGAHGAAQDMALAEHYMQRAAMQGSVEGARGLAVFYSSATFGAVNETLSAFYMGMASTMGSEHAMHMAGKLLVDKKKPMVGHELLQRAPSAAIQDATPEWRQWATHSAAALAAVARGSTPASAAASGAGAASGAPAE